MLVSFLLAYLLCSLQADLCTEDDLIDHITKADLRAKLRQSPLSELEQTALLEATPE